MTWNKMLKEMKAFYTRWLNNLLHVDMFFLRNRLEQILISPAFTNP
jgi:hypothetical protein